MTRPTLPTLEIELTTVAPTPSGRPMASYVSTLSVTARSMGWREQRPKVGLQGGVVGGAAAPSSAARPELHDFWSVHWADDCRHLCREFFE